MKKKHPPVLVEIIVDNRERHRLYLPDETGNLRHDEIALWTAIADNCSDHIDVIHAMYRQEGLVEESH